MNNILDLLPSILIFSMFKSSSIREISSKIGLKAMAIVTGSIVVLTLIYKSYKYALLDAEIDPTLKSETEDKDNLDSKEMGMPEKGLGDSTDGNIVPSSSTRNCVSDGLFIDVLINQVKSCDDDDDEKLLRLLQHITNQAAFSQFQKSFGNHGGVAVVITLLKHNNPDVQQQTCLAINNLAMIPDNHPLLQDAIPLLLALLSTNEKDFKIAVAKALTNLTTLEIGQITILSSISIIIKELQTSQICKLQLMKILVNVTCNTKFSQETVGFLQQIFDAVAITLIKSQLTEEDILLRGLFCIKNLLSLDDSNFTINYHLWNRLQELSTHENENLRTKCSEILSLSRTSSVSSITNGFDVEELEESFSKLSITDSDD